MTSPENSPSLQLQQMKVECVGLDQQRQGIARLIQERQVLFDNLPNTTLIDWRNNWEDAIRFAGIREKVAKTVNRRQVLLAGAEGRYNNLRASIYLLELQIRSGQLEVLREKHTAGMLPDEAFANLSQKYEELVKLPENDPVLCEAIERVRPDFLTNIATIETKSTIDRQEFAYSPGNTVRGRQAVIATLLSKTNSESHLWIGDLIQTLGATIPAETLSFHLRQVRKGFLRAGFEVVIVNNQGRELQRLTDEATMYLRPVAEKVKQSNAATPAVVFDSELPPEENSVKKN